METSFWLFNFFYNVIKYQASKSSTQTESKNCI